MYMYNLHVHVCNQYALVYIQCTRLQWYMYCIHVHVHICIYMYIQYLYVHVLWYTQYMYMYSTCTVLTSGGPLKE